MLHIPRGIDIYNLPLVIISRLVVSGSPVCAYVYYIISELLEEILVLLRHVSPVGQPQGGRLPVGSSGRLGKWPLRDREILRSSRCGEYYIAV